MSKLEKEVKAWDKLIKGKTYLLQVAQHRLKTMSIKEFDTLAEYNKNFTKTQQDIIDLKEVIKNCQKMREITIDEGTSKSKATNPIK